MHENGVVTGVKQDMQDFVDHRVWGANHWILVRLDHEAAVGDVVFTQELFVGRSVWLVNQSATFMSVGARSIFQTLT